jgi:hypothetical protein
MDTKETEKKVVTYEFHLTDQQVEDIVFNTVTGRLTYAPGDPDYREELEYLVEDFIETYGLHFSTYFNGSIDFYPDESSKFNATQDILVEMIERRM